MKNNIPNDYKDLVVSIYNNSGIVLTNEELKSIDYADFSLNNIKEEGLNIILYVNNDRYCAKEMVLIPEQTCPEHLHPDIKELNKKGKQETFRCRWGEVDLFVEGDTESKIELSLPKENSEYYTATKRINLKPGDQYTINPGIKHWFKAGKDGAVISEFSSPSYDEYDVFTNPSIKRIVRDR